MEVGELTWLVRRQAVEVDRESPEK